MSVLDSINSLSDDIKTMQSLLDKNGISYKNDIGYPLDDVATISNYIDELEIENQNLKIKIDALKNANRDERPVQVTNLDILKRLSKLETAVFGPNSVDYDL